MEHMNLPARTFFISSFIILSILTGAIVAFLPVFNEQNELVILSAVALIIVLLPIIKELFQSTKHALSPWVVYPVFYYLATFGLIVRIDWFGFPVRPITALHNLTASIYMAFGGLITFYIGIILAHVVSAKQKQRTNNALPPPTEDLGSLKIKYRISLNIVYISIFSLILGLGMQWSLGRGVNQYNFGLAYYLFLGGTMFVAYALWTNSFLCVKLHKKVFNKETLTLFIILSVILASYTERNTILLTSLGLFTIAHLQGYIKTKHIILFSTLAVLFVALLGLGRGVRAQNPVAMVQGVWDQIRNQEVGALDIYDQVLLSTEPPQNVFTRIIDYYSDIHTWRWGMTYVESIINLIPGFIFGSNWDRPFLQPNLIFKMLYDPRNPDQGYGFSLIAEAYMNFGPFGPLLILFLIGFTLNLIYLRAYRRPQSYATLVYAMLLPTITWALRADSGGLLKNILYFFLLLIIVEISGKISKDRTCIAMLSEL